VIRGRKFCDRREKILKFDYQKDMGRGEGL
jgi:hypothetical protein